MGKGIAIFAVIVIIGMIVIGGMFAPELWNRLANALAGLGSDNQAQINWFAELANGTEIDLDPTLPFNVMYEGVDISYIGFKTSVKLTYSGEIQQISYAGTVALMLDGSGREVGTVQTLTMSGSTVAESGGWFVLFGMGISVGASTIENWEGATMGTHTLGGHVAIDMMVYHVGQTGGGEGLQGEAWGSCTINIYRDATTMEVAFNPVSVSVFPTALN